MPASDKRASRGTFERGRGRGESTRARGERGRGAGRGASQSTSRPPRQNGAPVNGASTAPAAAAPDVSWGTTDDWSTNKTSSWADAVTDGPAEKAPAPSKPAPPKAAPAESKPVQAAAPAPSAPTNAAPPPSVPSTSKTIPAKPKASWAQIVKPEPKPEPKPAPKAAAASAAPVSATNPQDIKPSAKPAQAADPSDGPDTKVQVSELETQSIPVADITNEPSQNVKTVAPSAGQAPAPVGPPGFNKPQTGAASGSYSRRLKQEAAVVMPGQANNLGSVGVQFGSLSLSSAQDEALVDDKKAATNVAPEAPVQQPPQQPSEPAQAPSQPQQYPSQPGYPSQQAYRQQQGFDGSAQLGQSQSSYLPQPASTTAESTQFNSAQSPYAAFPGQPAGFGLGQSADYAALYGSSDAQRAAMGYYDPATYGQPGYGQQQQGRTADNKFGQQGQDALGSSVSSTTPGSAPSTTPQQQQQQQQQAYPGMGMPYYPYYYMPNQFPGAYQQSGYGQSGYGQPYGQPQSRYPPYNQQGQGHQGRHQNNKGGAGGYQQQYSQQQSYDTDATASAGSFGQYDRYGAGGNDQFNSFLGGQQGKQSYDKQQSSTPTAESAQYSQAQYGGYQQQPQQQSQPQTGSQSQPQSAGFGSNSGYGQYLGGYPQGQGQQRSQQYWNQ